MPDKNDSVFMTNLTPHELNHILFFETLYDSQCKEMHK